MGHRKLFLTEGQHRSCKSWNEVVADSLLCRFFLGRILKAHRAKKHFVDLFQPISTKRRCRHAVNICGINFLQYGTQRLRGTVVALVYQDHTILPKPWMEHPFFTQRTRHSNVHNACGCILRAVNHAYNAFSPSFPSGLRFILRQILLKFQELVQCLLPLVDQCRGFQQN